jgi:hypothetical protein
MLSVTASPFPDRHRPLPEFSYDFTLPGNMLLRERDIGASFIQIPQ